MSASAIDNAPRDPPAMTPTEARAYIALFRKFTVPGAERAWTGERVIHLDDMTDADAVFVAREFQRMEAEAAKGVRRQ